MQGVVKNSIKPKPRPGFVRAKSRFRPEIVFLRAQLRKLHLRTVCESAHCPNLGECFARKIATFMILGNVCARNCSFCAVKKGKPEPLDPKEPEHIAQIAKELALKHIVITSVTRDDLFDQGAEQFYKTIVCVKTALPGSTVEVLTPDFQGRMESVERVLESKPEVFNHNVETVSRLYALVRPGADYNRSLSIISFVKRNAPEIITKSGLMLGMGEEKEEVVKVMEDLVEVGCEVLTLGQYLAPSRTHCRVRRYYLPEEFDALKETGLKMGFKQVFSGPLVRSSFQAEELYLEFKQGEKR